MPSFLKDGDLGEWLDSLELSGTLPGDYPIGAVKNCMVLGMRSNIFEWGDMYFL